MTSYTLIDNKLLRVTNYCFLNSFHEHSIKERELVNNWYMLKEMNISEFRMNVKQYIDLSFPKFRLPKRIVWMGTRICKQDDHNLPHH